MQRGDMIVAVDGQPLDGISDFREKLAAKDTVKLSIVRGADKLDVDVKPKDGRIGIAPNERYPQEGFFATMVTSVRACWNTTVSTLANIAALIHREPGADVGGPIA